MTSTDSASGRKPIRWWPAAAILVLFVMALAWIWLGEEPTRQYRIMKAYVAGFVTFLLLLLWFLALSRLRWKQRLLGFGVLILVGVLITQTVRIRGVTGDLLPILSWRWSGGLSSGVGGGSASPEQLAPTAHDFPQFLGAHRDGRISGVALARDWQARKPRQVWRREVGAGWASFAVVGKVAITQEQRGDQELVIAYDLETGEPIWSHAEEAHFNTPIGGEGPRSTPTVDGDRVFTLGATGILNALDLATGERLWSHDVVKEHNARRPEWGKSCSPLVVDGLVVVSAGGREGNSLVAYDRESGDLVWAGGSDRSGYSSAVEAELAGVRQLLILNGESLAAHDPADGSVLWEFPWPSDQPNVAQPLPLPGDRVLGSSGYGIGSKVLQVSRDEAGELSVELVWESPRLKLKFTHAVYHEGTIYGLDDGVLVALDPETGERRWKRGRYGHGQMLLVGDLLLIQAEQGDVVLVEANPEEHRELGRFTAFDRKTWNVPTLAGPYLLVRNDREAALYELPLAG